MLSDTVKKMISPQRLVGGAFTGSTLLEDES